MALDKRLISAVVLVLLVAIVAVALLFGVQSAKVGQSSLQNVAVQITDPLYGPSAVSSLNVTYSSVGLDVVAANGSSSWYNYNASGNLDLLKLQNYTYTMTQFGLPLNSSVDGARLYLTGANLSIYGTAGKTFITNSSLYVQLSQARISGTGTTILLSLSPSVLPIQNQSGLYFAITPKLSAGAVNGGLSFTGGFQPLNASVIAGLQGTRSLALVSGQITAEANQTRILLTVRNEGNSPESVGPIIIVGNFSSHGISNATALAAVLSGAFSTNTINKIFSANTVSALNSSGSAVANITSSINTTELSKIEQNLPAGMRENLTAAVSSSGSGISGAISAFLGNLNSNSLGNVTSKFNLGSGFNLSSFGGLAGGLESIFSSFKNSSIEASVISDVIQNQYDQYVAKAKVLGGQEHGLNAVTLFAEHNGTLVTLSTASQLYQKNWDVLQAGESLNLTFNGTLSSAGNGFFSVSSNNTYKIILSGDSSTLNVTAH